MTTEAKNEVPTEEELRNREGIDILRRVSGEFPTSLVSQFDEGNVLSDKQWEWVGRLAHRHLTEPEPAVPVSVNLAPIMDMFRLAGSKIQWPKIRISDGQPEGTTKTGEICFAIAGPRSKYSGDVMVTDGGPFGSNAYYGRIEQRTSDFHPNARCCNEGIIKQINAFSENPVEVSVAYARLTGACSFCGTEIKTDTSLHVGYGPTCAKNFGLPYPTKGEMKAIKAALAAAAETE